MTNEWAQKARVLSFAGLSARVQYNTLAYWAHSQVKKKMKCCEYSLGKLKLFELNAGWGSNPGPFCSFSLFSLPLRLS